MTTRWKKPGTAITGAAWVVVCAYLYFAWPSLAALLETLAPPGAGPALDVPRAAFPAIAVVATLGLALKDRWLRAPFALAVDAVVAAPALAAIAFLIEPFLVPVE